MKPQRESPPVQQDDKKGVEIAALAGMIYSEFESERPQEKVLEATLPRGSGYRSGLKPR
jgi:hypothetical protein